MGACCSSPPPDLTAQNHVNNKMRQLFVYQSQWMGSIEVDRRFSIAGDPELEYLEIEVVSKNDEPLRGRRIINIAEDVFSESVVFDFRVEQQPDKEWIPVFHWEDVQPDGQVFILEGTLVEPNKKKISGNFKFENYRGTFEMVRANAPCGPNDLPVYSSSEKQNNVFTKSTKKLLTVASSKASEKFDIEEQKRVSKIEERAMQAAASEAAAATARRSSEIVFPPGR